MAVIQTPADRAFSKCVRERVNWTCERCGTYYAEDKRAGLHCSYHYSPDNWIIRFHPLAAEALCVNCKRRFGGTLQRRLKMLPVQDQRQLVSIMSNSIVCEILQQMNGQGPIARHFRHEFKRMCWARRAGYAGRIEFMAFEFEGYQDAGT